MKTKFVKKTKLFTVDDNIAYKMIPWCDILMERSAMIIESDLIDFARSSFHCFRQISLDMTRQKLLILDEIFGKI